MASLVRRPTGRHNNGILRLRYENGCEPRLLGLPEELLLYTLEFAVLPEDGFATEIWQWLGQLASVCRIFRRLTRQRLQPQKFSARVEEVQTRTALLASLVRSFSRDPWKTASLKDFLYKGFDANNFNQDGTIVLEAIYSLFETPGALPNLANLRLHIANDGGIIDANFLYTIARNLPSLSVLHLLGAFREFVLGRRVTPAEFRTFATMLRRPLRGLALSCSEMTDAHLCSFLRYHGSSLVSLHLDINFPVIDDSDAFLNDSTLAVIGEHCSQLQGMCFRASNMTDGLESCIRIMRGVRTLDLSLCDHLGLESIDILTHHCLQLRQLLVVKCDWFTDDCLERLVQSQIDFWTRRVPGLQQIPLVHVQAAGSRVTQVGILRVLLKPLVGGLRVRLEE